MPGTGTHSEAESSLARILETQNRVGKNVATLLGNSRMAYETGDDALIEQSEAALRSVLLKPLTRAVQMAYETGDDALISQSEHLLHGVLPPDEIS